MRFADIADVDSCLRQCCMLKHDLRYYYLPASQLLSVRLLSRPSDCRATKRLFLLDYDGTLTQPSSHNNTPTPEVLAILQGLVQDPKNSVWIISGRGRSELGPWFQPLVSQKYISLSL